MIYTAYTDYFATGEGQSYMVLVMIAENEASVRERFVELFTDYMAQGIIIKEGLFLDFPRNELLVSDRLRALLSKWDDNEIQSPMFEWYTSLYFNFS